jgi:hypothetical protein
MEPKNNQFNFRYTIDKKDIPDFVRSLQQLQEHYVEAAIEQKAREGFPEATQAIKRIMDMK